MTAVAIGRGERVYLVPRTKTAPNVAYRRPQVTVVSVCWPLYVVRLDDGAEVTTHHSNLVRERPGASRRPRPPKTRPAPDGVENLPLWT
jgi:hypothetical protein